MRTQFIVLTYTANIWCAFDMNDEYDTKNQHKIFANEINVNYGMCMYTHAAAAWDEYVVEIRHARNAYGELSYSTTVWGNSWPNQEQ